MPKNIPIKPVARLILKAQAEQESQLKVLEQALKNSRHWKWIKSDPVPPERAEKEKNAVVYELDVLPLRPEDYRTVITVGNNVTSTDGSSTNRPGSRRTVRPAGGSRP